MFSCERGKVVPTKCRPTRVFHCRLDSIIGIPNSWVVVLWLIIWSSNRIPIHRNRFFVFEYKIVVLYCKYKVLVRCNPAIILVQTRLARRIYMTQCRIPLHLLCYVWSLDVCIHRFQVCTYYFRVIYFLLWNIKILNLSYN